MIIYTQLSVHTDIWTSELTPADQSRNDGMERQNLSGESKNPRSVSVVNEEGNVVGHNNYS